MASGSGAGIVKREFIKSEFDRKIDLSSIPRATTTVPATIKKYDDTKDIKLSLPHFSAAPGPQRPGRRHPRRRGYGNFISYKSGEMRIKAHYDIGRKVVRYTIMNGPHPSVGNSVYQMAESSVFSQLRVKANFNIQPRNPGSFSDHVATVMTNSLNSKHIEVEVPVEPCGGFRTVFTAPPPPTPAPVPPVPQVVQVTPVVPTPAANPSPATKQSPMIKPTLAVDPSPSTNSFTTYAKAESSTSATMPFASYAKLESPFAALNKETMSSQSGPIKSCDSTRAEVRIDG